MKTLLATLVGLGLLTGTANAQYVRIIPSYGISPEICAPGFVHQYQHGHFAPRVAEAPAAQAEQPADEAAPEAPAEAAPATPGQPAPEAPLPPK